MVHLLWHSREVWRIKKTVKKAKIKITTNQCDEEDIDGNFGKILGAVVFVVVFLFLTVFQYKAGKLDIYFFFQKEWD